MGGRDLFIYGQNSISIIIVQFFFFVLEGLIINFVRIVTKVCILVMCSALKDLIQFYKT